MTDQSTIERSEITTERIAELKKLAEAASPGPWEYRMLSKEIPAPRIDSASGKVVMKTWNVLYSNCEFIAAANPQAILSLIGHIAELERKNAQLTKKLEKALATVKAAYLEGFFAMETYNDKQLNDENEAFKTSGAAQFIASHHKEDTPS